MFIPHVQTNHQQMFVFVFDANPTRSQLTYCFSCGEVGKLDKLKICSQCEEAYYCNEECERVHAKAHGPVCIATLCAFIHSWHPCPRAPAQIIPLGLSQSARAIESHVTEKEPIRFRQQNRSPQMFSLARNHTHGFDLANIRKWAAGGQPVN